MAAIELQAWMYLVLTMVLSLVIGVCVNRLMERRRLVQLGQLQ